MCVFIRVCCLGVGASCPAFSGPEAFFSGEGGVVFFWAYWLGLLPFFRDESAGRAVVGVPGFEDLWGGGRILGVGV